MNYKIETITPEFVDILVVVKGDNHFEVGRELQNRLEAILSVRQTGNNPYSFKVKCPPEDVKKIENIINDVIEEFKTKGG